MDDSSTGSVIQGDNSSHRHLKAVIFHLKSDQCRLRKLMTVSTVISWVNCLVATLLKRAQSPPH